MAPTSITLSGWLAPKRLDIRAPPDMPVRADSRVYAGEALAEGLNRCQEELRIILEVPFEPRSDRHAALRERDDGPVLRECLHSAQEGLSLRTGPASVQAQHDDRRWSRGCGEEEAPPRARSPQ